MPLCLCWCRCCPCVCAAAAALVPVLVLVHLCSVLSRCRVGPTTPAPPAYTPPTLKPDTPPPMADETTPGHLQITCARCTAYHSNELQACCIQSQSIQHSWSMRHSAGLRSYLALTLGIDPHYAVLNLRSVSRHLCSLVPLTRLALIHLDTLLPHSAAFIVLVYLSHLRNISQLASSHLPLSFESYPILLPCSIGIYLISVVLDSTPL